jgi:N-acetylneuraminate synthase
MAYGFKTKNQKPIAMSHEPIGLKNEILGGITVIKSSSPSIACQGRIIGEGHRPFIIAEAGVHHNCSLQKAFELVDAAVETGVDAIKFQTYRAEKLVTTWAPRYWDCGEKPGTQFDTFQERDKFGFEEYKKIAEYCKVKGIIFLSTPFDEEAVEWLDKLEMPLYKVASADITHFPLLKRIAQTGKPVVLSTGASEAAEINEAIGWLKQNGTKEIALLHCCLSYPTPDEQANLKKIQGLRQEFPDYVIGYSDHTIPDEAVSVLLGAAALGASIIETHFTLDRSLPEDDHYHAVDKVLLKRLVDGAKILAKALGTPKMTVAECEIPARNNARRSIVANEPIAAGTVIKYEHLDFKRPGLGLAPTKVQQVLGKKVLKDIPADGLVLLENLR